LNINLTTAQKDYAHFLPALSGFYATYIGKQRFDNYVDPARIPSNFKHGVESLNYLNQQQGAFTYKWSLYSAGHANLDTTIEVPKEDMVRNRDRENTWLLGDSGGFQIGKGVWEGDWKDPNCPKAQKKRDGVLKWMDAYMDYGMVLDIPAWVARSPEGAKATGIDNYQDAVNATRINNDYWMKNRTGACKFLNVLQGETHTDAEDWYQQMKDYCDPKKYTDHFNGWSMGGQNMCDIHLALLRLISLRYDGLLEKGLHDVMHFLGTSKLEWATLLTDVQRAVRKYHNENFTITFDCASPFLATANGQIYIQNETADRSKWTYRMVPSVDDKKYATDNRLFKDAVISDGIFKNFEDSPITAELKVSDVCTYAPGDLNKIGKEGKTSWDSFSYAIQMGHNVWSHINAVQEANRQYDNGIIPSMLVEERFDRLFFRDIVEAIFATDKKDEAIAVANEFRRYLDTIIGTRGATGKRMTNAQTYFNNLFDTVEETNEEIVDGEFSEEQENKLEEMENEQL
tara:strand:- start:5956 stop:7497 length:1542 start_codon:yes stop_codon:yes gene_type:complete